MKFKIKKYLTRPKYNLTKCNDRRFTLEYIVIHYTGGKGSAKNNIDYFRGGDRSASADFFIDDNYIWRYNPNCRFQYSWHCGDGHGKYGISNANSIGIEVVSNGEEFSQGEKERLRDLVKYLMNYYHLTADAVVRHYDASRKVCPYPYCGTPKKNDKWAELHKYITT